MKTFNDASREFTPFDRSKAGSNRHPNKYLNTPHPVSGKSGARRKHG